MYDSPSTIMRGWSRIFFGSSCGSPWRSLMVMFFIAGRAAIPVLLRPRGEIYRFNHPIGFSVAFIGAFPGSSSRDSLDDHDPSDRRHLPMDGRSRDLRARLSFTGIFVLAILARAVWMCITGRVSWRGTTYSHQIEMVQLLPNHDAGKFEFLDLMD